MITGSRHSIQTTRKNDKFRKQDETRQDTLQQGVQLGAPEGW